MIIIWIGWLQNLSEIFIVLDQNSQHRVWYSAMWHWYRHLSKSQYFCLTNSQYIFFWAGFLIYSCFDESFPAWGEFIPNVLIGRIRRTATPRLCMQHVHPYNTDTDILQTQTQTQTQTQRCMKALTDVKWQDVITGFYRTFFWGKTLFKKVFGILHFSHRGQQGQEMLSHIRLQGNQSSREKESL